MKAKSLSEDADALLARAQAITTVLSKKREELGKEFMLTHVAEDKDIWGAIKHFFAKDNVVAYTEAS